MRMTSREDMSAAAASVQRRTAAGRNATGSRAPFPSDLTLQIDNFTSGPSTPAFTPVPRPRHYEPKGFLAEVAQQGRRREARVSMPLFLEEVPYSRMSLPPIVPVEVDGTEVAALIHTASHISLVSSALVQELGVRQDVLPDTSIPPSPLAACNGTHWLVEGKLRYVELSLRGAKHVTQLHVARDLPTDLVLGADFLKKARVQVSFPESAITLPSGTQETKVAFLTSKEMTQHNQRRPANASTSSTASTITGGGRSYSSNY
ncbi:uncharacterized protein LOC127001738 [Eriocheir sinensis]|uniref:uncharacterized protein LOC127001738 n=1 Tax=Eriocheir sinensis TaxID=95602 RepID=UPI0021C5BB2D|nr:uncharacterized protein LOC127001738 [Eriocheir sinensis]XP_050722813.1 uncharacterized protein LOC127001738 [Eriocheir sinensis]XP_050722814.1 uncharacterized protein LOC127001738 [Eriocheir sinensis]XP_050722815.1 uncharacterized protein LOC127001738 [Eriocheir sinensis]XP_050722817.1 uncharacterized protein LOC127001738 [Eriocheir sinensis]XP_050722818.1 uncharacterized protein LOC127001738 [Eriocheir sinensis]XP_050722819.1 uncharacterized protein LOC127001738 [Eriocheir sinensis]XP_0